MRLDCSISYVYLANHYTQSWCHACHFLTQWFAHQRRPTDGELCWQHCLLVVSRPRPPTKVMWCPTACVHMSLLHASMCSSHSASRAGLRRSRCQWTCSHIGIWETGSNSPSVMSYYFWGNALLFQPALQRETVEIIHSGHQGIQQCLLQITSAMWWLNTVKHEMNILCRTAPPAQRLACHNDSPCSPQSFQDHPWEKVINDFFYFNGKTYTLITTVEVGMRTLDQFFEIEFLTHYYIKGLRLSLYHVLERKRFYDRATEHRSQQGRFSLSPPRIYEY